MREEASRHLLDIVIVAAGDKVNEDRLTRRQTAYWLLLAQQAKFEILKRCIPACSQRRNGTCTWPIPKKPVLWHNWNPCLEPSLFEVFSTMPQAFGREPNALYPIFVIT